MKHIAILGSTGSIGQNTLAVIRKLPDKFKVTALSANASVEILSRQIKEFKPRFVCVGEAGAAKKIKGALGAKVKVFSGPGGIK
ncbi:MAG: 1-deoxy-D-xylulose-5-phosphate reductoisomerase, partial [Candidatus Omnitrophica bacterium]|nr:1-deoxy-D-xylulose-5-phosphate reductoisomerase [Candidatus Omnitrophota bacterium]